MVGTWSWINFVVSLSRRRISPRESVRWERRTQNQIRRMTMMRNTATPETVPAMRAVWSGFSGR